MSSIARLCAAAALTLSTPAFAWNGKVFIDCHDLLVPSTSSPDNLKIKVMENGAVIKEASVDLQSKYPNQIDAGTCPVGVWVALSEGALLAPILEFSASASSVQVIFTATGSNAIWLDRVVVETKVPYDDNEFGVDGKKGWCLSTDSSDTFGSDRQDGNCQKSVTFNVMNTARQ